MTADLGPIPCPACGKDLRLRAETGLHEVTGPLRLNVIVEPHECAAPDPLIACKHCDRLIRQSECCMFVEPEPAS